MPPGAGLRRSWEIYPHLLKALLCRSGSLPGLPHHMIFVCSRPLKHVAPPRQPSREAVRHLLGC